MRLKTPQTNKDVCIKCNRDQLFCSIGFYGIIPFYTLLKEGFVKVLTVLQQAISYLTNVSV